MHKVLAIGGYFFRSRDPKALARWYEAHLGIAPAEGNPIELWQEEQPV